MSASTARRTKSAREERGNGLERRRRTAHDVRDTGSTGDEQDLVELLRIGTASIRSLNRQPQVGRSGRRLGKAVGERFGHAVAGAHHEKHLVAAVLVRFVAVGDVGDGEGVRLEVDVRGTDEGRVPNRNVGWKRREISSVHRSKEKGEQKRNEPC